MYSKFKLYQWQIKNNLSTFGGIKTAPLYILAKTEHTSHKIGIKCETISWPYPSGQRFPYCFYGLSSRLSFSVPLIKESLVKGDGEQIKPSQNRNASCTKQTSGGNLANI